MQITITNANQPVPEPSPGGDPLIPKSKVVEVLRSLADRPGDAVPLEEVRSVIAPFLSNLQDKEIYERTSGYVQILDEVLKQLKPQADTPK